MPCNSDHALLHRHNTLSNPAGVLPRGTQLACPGVPLWRSQPVGVPSDPGVANQATASRKALAAGRGRYPSIRLALAEEKYIRLPAIFSPSTVNSGSGASGRSLATASTRWAI